MATASGDSSSKDGHGCPICLDVFTSPRQLPCLHSFCDHCLQDYVTKKATGTSGVFEDFLCPVCRAVTRPVNSDKPVEEWASSFPESPISLIAESKVKVDRHCDICSSKALLNLATKVCINCEEAMCDDCSFAHQTMKMSRNHQLLSVEELEKNPQCRMRLAKGFGCPEHHDKAIEFYCKIHEAACCATCSFLHHKSCTEVQELKTNLADLLKNMNSHKIMEELSKLGDYLKVFAEMNETNINILESRVKDLTEQVGEIRMKINALLDDIEKTVKREGHIIYKEEMIKKQEENHQCQSFINAIRNSHAFLETVSQYGTDTQKFLVTSKTMRQLQSYRSQIEEKFEKVDSIKVMLDFDSHMKGVLEKEGTELVKVVSTGESTILYSTSNIKPLGERKVEMLRGMTVNCPSDWNPDYRGIAQLQGGELVLADSNNETCYLYDSTYNSSTMYRLRDWPSDMCLMDDHEVAVALPAIKTVQFLSTGNRTIKDMGMITTRYRCYSVAAVNTEEIVVSGHCGGDRGSNRCYWSLISKDGTEKFHHEFDCQETSQAYIAVNTSKSRVYISVKGGNAVYCFGLTNGIQYFVYNSKDMKSPLGVAVDRDDNVYVVGYNSCNIHKLSPDGVILQIISSLVPKYPSRLTFISNGEQFILTNNSNEECRILHHFIHK
ncbi:hypothetical protein ACJMK2_009351 [Sinanodonta woodiana]|uniref:RING-type domain-containing protein n=1 Tax=Sinanodonta woodiana TaxID=1069815 RepID=A0ABD3VC07_SINWO